MNTGRTLLGVSVVRTLIVLVPAYAMTTTIPNGGIVFGLAVLGRAGRWRARP